MKTAILGSVLLLIMLSIARPGYSDEGFTSACPNGQKLDVELRHRYEYMSDFDFDNTIDDDKGFNLYRARFNFTLQPSDEIKFSSQFQDALSQTTVSAAQGVLMRTGMT